MYYWMYVSVYAFYFIKETKIIFLLKFLPLLAKPQQFEKNNLLWELSENTSI